MSSEYKHFELRRAIRSSESPRVSTVVLVTREDGKRGHCFVRFSDSFVRFVGQKLPRGVAEFDPAYLDVIYTPATKTWVIRAFYLRDGVGAILWETGTAPSWLSFRTETSNGNPSSAHSRRTGIRAGRSRRSTAPGRSDQGPAAGCTA